MGPNRVREYDIDALERQLERTEDADADAHPIYNNLGLAYSAKGNYRKALLYHRREKQACKRLASLPKAGPERLIDLAIAYRLVGDATMRVDKLVLSKANESTSNRLEILQQAYQQHEKARQTSLQALEQGGTAAFELQASTAALAQSSISIALETQDSKDFTKAATLAGASAYHADRLTDKEAGGQKTKTAMMLAAAVNLGLAHSGMGDKKRAKTLFQAAGVLAQKLNAVETLIQCVANLAQEAEDESDWDLCLDYANEWVALSQKIRDKAEEADALRRRGKALAMTRQFDVARAAFEKAEVYGRDKTAKEDARVSLEWVEKEIQSQKENDAALDRAVQQCEKAVEECDFVAEARARIDAGEAAFNIARFDAAIDHFGRYFQLVDEYACSVGVTGIEHRRHCLSVTSMAEALHHEKKFEEAVLWAERELEVCDADDKAAKASAYCNIGNYNDDLGKFDAAKESLLRSIALATEAGDDVVLEKAQTNLSIVLENEAEALKGKKSPDDDYADVMDVDAESFDRGISSRDYNHSDENEHVAGNDNLGGRAPGIRDPRATEAGEESICILSMPTGNAETRPAMSRTTGDADPNVSRVDSSRGRSSSKTIVTASRSAADRSVGGVRRLIDVAELYQKRCIASSEGPRSLKVEARQIVVQRLQPLSAKLVSMEAGDELVIDISLCFLCDDEFPLIVETLVALPSDTPPITLNCSLNPLLTGESIRWLSSSANGPSRPWATLVSLDLSGTGLDSSCLGPLARALAKNGMLPSVRSLSLGKNSIGDADKLTANAVGLLVMQDSRLEHLDISLNLLSNRFLVQLADALGLLAKQKPQGSATSLKTLDVRLNNRRAPTALLEVSSDGFSAPEDAIGCIERILEAIPSLTTLDLRACGADAPLRRKLFQLRSKLRPEDNLLSLVPESGPVTDIIVVSPTVFDPEDKPDAVV